MKRKVALIVAVAMVLMLCACGGGKKEFEASKVAYETIDTAYKITEQMGSDVYEAWRMGIYESDEILEDGCGYLATELSLSAEELRVGAAYTIAGLIDEDWETMSEEDKKDLINTADDMFSVFEDDLFTFCVMTVTGAYAANGKAEEAKTALTEAKGMMKELSEKYSDYEHYPNLKGFYTTTNSFFEFCQDPTGSFEQVKQTINDYKNEARDYISDLDYIFE